VPIPDGLLPEPAVPDSVATIGMMRRWTMATDPVCKMSVEPEKAAAKAEHAGQVYYFCSDTCHKAFSADPEKYISGK